MKSPFTFCLQVLFLTLLLIFVAQKASPMPPPYPQELQEPTLSIPITNTSSLAYPGAAP
jgi:hypothetical protein